jgi:hypothetical protein
LDDGVRMAWYGAIGGGGAAGLGIESWPNYDENNHDQVLIVMPNIFKEDNQKLVLKHGVAIKVQQNVVRTRGIAS